MSEMKTIEREYERAKTLEDYEAVNVLWLVLLKVAYQMSGTTEHERLKALIEKFPIISAKELLASPAVDSLTNLSPPLETVLVSRHERLDEKKLQNTLEVIRREKEINPIAALICLGEILKRIRNKREHGFKTPYSSRDSEILSASRTILEWFCAMALQTAG